MGKKGATKFPCSFVTCNEDHSGTFEVHMEAMEDVEDVGDGTEKPHVTITAAFQSDEEDAIPSTDSFALTLERA